MIFTEGMYGTSKSSYLKLENARMIVRHSSKIDETKMGARSRFVESIFIENSVGERFLFPTTNLAPARAMTQHINHDGSFADQVGEQILRIAGEYSNLGAVSKHVFSNGNMNESALMVREACRSKMREMRKVFEKMTRPSGYVAEAAKITEMLNSKTLNETETKKAIPAKFIKEMRDILMVEGVEIADHIVEAACKCMMDQTNEDYLLPPKTEKDDNKSFRKLIADKKEETVEENTATKTVVATDLISVLGKPVSKAVWEAFKDGHLSVDRKPGMRDSDNDPSAPKFVDKSAEIFAKLASVLPIVKDDGMRGLLIFVSDALEDPSNRDFAAAKKANPDIMRSVRAIASQAVKIADASIDEGLAVNNSVIREFAEWVNKFSTKNVLSEDYRNASPPGWDDSSTDEAVERAVKNFDANEFYESPVAQDVAAPEDFDKMIEKSTIMSALSDYLNSEVESDIGRYPGDLTSDAEEVYDAVVAVYQEHDYTVKDDTVDEDADPVVSESQDDNDLTREDVLLPSGNQGQGLAREVLAPTVQDPQTGKEEAPTGSYIDRLRTLSGMNKGR